MHRCLALIVALCAIAAVPARAGVLPGDAGVQGNDPAGGCDASAYTVESQPLENTDSTFGYLDLRYSPTCQANWARVRMLGRFNRLDYKLRIFQSSVDAAYTVSGGYYGDPAEATAWTPMVSSPQEAGSYPHHFDLYGMGELEGVDGPRDCVAASILVTNSIDDVLADMKHTGCY